ncbi:hypothetical protein BO79DRAFT_228588 [Aspergillus costaricaensis CBS 115574]|uniref:Uncharacterized protein n=1 Tax=Aspergillus costaricaensis CBS 115574 TaxID=1448317 RepID=A0ACD1IEN3_9EURO|nr:hypothetical protein BO79DRAFT_228588 [Aspergillus costaricaensis CBS 115574]RAK88546.1 hypothetical protein BO79DRAFT_228588 [Aspergillus costaricaensis CBS 115574]
MPPPEYHGHTLNDGDSIKLQHHLTTELFGYLLHLDIPLQNANLKIADIAARFLFCDYRNVPTELEGAYDVVHVRNIVFVLSDEEIEDVLSKLLKLLSMIIYKWIPTPFIDKINGECSTAAIEEIVRITRSADPRLMPHWVPELPRLFESVGLVDLRKDTREGPGHIDYTFHECVLMVHDMIARKTSNEGVGRRLKEILPEADCYWKKA